MSGADAVQAGTIAATGATRYRYVDWARALAVLLMIEAHTVDAWTRAVDRTGIAYRNAIVLGGFAAPLFLWLAGVAVVMAAEARLSRTGRRSAAVEGVCRRGLEIFILAFLFRLQAFIVTPGSSPLTIFRVDILNIMGPAVVLAAIVWGLGATTARRAAAFSMIAVALAVLTPIVRASRTLSALPALVQWYLRPAGEQTTFTAFPWAGFVFGGAAAGVLIVAAKDPRQQWRLHLGLAAAGAALIGLGFYTATLAPIYRETSFWTSSPTYFAIRAGVLLIAVSAIFFAARMVDRLGLGFGPLDRMGRSSLFVYWIHVELVYGYASWLFRGRLPLWGTMLGWALFSALMYGAIVLRDRILQSRGSRRRPLRMTTAPATS